jgi:hypothetical protein
MSIFGTFPMTDKTENSIFVAVGKATSKWETLEWHLAFMFTIFEGKPIDHKTVEAYGRESKIFKDRMSTLRKSAEKYFRANPDQHEEGRVECLIKEAERLANFRHRIAHGIVAGIKQHNGTDYRLMPPGHGFYHLTKREGDYNYSSDDIAGYTKEFMDLATKVQKFNHERRPP